MKKFVERERERDEVSGESSTLNDTQNKGSGYNAPKRFGASVSQNHTNRQIFSFHLDRPLVRALTGYHR